MFRKLLHIILAVFLFASTAQVTIYVHYCGGKLISASVNHKAKFCCEMDGCCKNKSLHFEVKDKFENPAAVEAIYIAKVSAIFPLLCIINNVPSRNSDSSFITFTDSSPPFLIQKGLFSFLQSYLF